MTPRDLILDTLGMAALCALIAAGLVAAGLAGPPLDAALADSAAALTGQERKDH